VPPVAFAFPPESIERTFAAALVLLVGPIVGATYLGGFSFA
jgi:hypothetical protein